MWGPEGRRDGCGLCSTFSPRILGLGHAWVQGKTLHVKTMGMHTGPEAGHAGEAGRECDKTRLVPTEVYSLFLHLGASYRVGSLSKF